MTRPLPDARLAELAAFCVSMADTRREAQPWADLATALLDLLDWRREFREVADWYTALVPVLESGDREALDRMLEAGELVGR
jgi:hypothetical protein